MQAIKTLIANKKISLSWLTLVIACALIYIALLSPQSNRLSELETQALNRQKEYEAALESNNIKVRSQHLQKLVAAQNTLDQYATGMGSISSMTLDIGRLAAQQKLKMFASKEITGKSYRELANCTEMGTNSIEVSFVASYPQFATFVNQLERHDPVIMADHFNITRTAKNANENEVEITLTVLVTKENIHQPVDELIESVGLTRQSLKEQTQTSLASQEGVQQK